MQSIKFREGRNTKLGDIMRSFLGFRELVVWCCLFLLLYAACNEKKSADSEPVQIFVGNNSPEGTVTRSANQTALTFVVSHIQQKVSGSHANDINLYGVGFRHHLANTTLNARLYVLNENVVAGAAVPNNPDQLQVTSTMRLVGLGTISDQAVTMNINVGGNPSLTITPRTSWVFVLVIDSSSIAAETEMHIDITSIDVAAIGDAPHTVKGDANSGEPDALLVGPTMTIITP